MTERRIDIHHHAMPPQVKALLVDRRLLPPVGGPPFASWDVDTALGVMDRTGIEVGVASAAIPSEFLGDDAGWAGTLTRAANESLAGLVAAHPTRFGFLAYLPLPFTDLAAAEAAYALDSLGADGIVLGSHAGGQYLGDPAFDEVLAALDQRSAVVLTHPFNLPACGVTPFPAFVADFMLDTTRAAIQLIMSGALERYPRISWVLPHSGGFLPYQAARLSLGGLLGYGLDAAAVGAALGRFHYDTAGPMSPYGTPTLLAAAGAERILYGSDYNAVPAPGIAAAAAALAADPALSAQALRLIGRENALRLLPGVAARLAAETAPV